MLVMSTPETFWWLSICNKIHFTKVNLLVYNMMMMMMMMLLLFLLLLLLLLLFQAVYLWPPNGTY